MLANQITDSIYDLNAPHNVTELKLFRGLYNRYWLFLSNSAHKAATSDKKLKKGNQECSTSLRKKRTMH